MQAKVKILRYLPEVFAECQPVVGKVYDASYQPPRAEKGNVTRKPICVIDVNGKKICLKPDEYEVCKA